MGWARANWRKWWATVRSWAAQSGSAVSTESWGENSDFKNDRVGRSAAISDATAELIIEHKQHMRERFPHTALADLALLP